jgi:glutamate racemase
LRAIGVFDSGVGGLTVLAALRAELPHEQFVYLGDTARLPYGTKSPETVVRYALQAADALIERGVKALIVACNTASTVALPSLRERYDDLPVIGVVEPGADAAVAATRSGCIAVIGTEATVRGGAYQRAIAQRRPEASVSALACQVFVALAEEGWTDGAVARATTERYLGRLFAPDAAGRPVEESGRGINSVPDTLVLGCTHFPVLRAVIREVIGEQVSIVDSAATTASAARALLGGRGLLRTDGAVHGTLRPLCFLATDGAARFAAIGGRFLGREIRAQEVELVDL